MLCVMVSAVLLVFLTLLLVLRSLHCISLQHTYPDKGCYACKLVIFIKIKMCEGVNSDHSVSLTTRICWVEQLVLNYGGFSVGVFSHSKAVVLIVMMERAALM